MNIFETEALRLEEVIGYSFANKSLLIEALSHSSYVNEQRKRNINCCERLEFLGRPAMTVTSAARLAVRSGCPVVIGSFVRVGPYRYRLVGGTPLEFSRGDDVRRVTQIFNDRLGEAIRQYPEQYLWSHRRWRED